MSRSWNRPVLRDHTTQGSTLGENTPFVFNDRLYVLQNFMRHNDFPGEEPQYRFHEDGCLIRDYDQDLILGYPWLNHYFTTATVHQGEVFLIGGDYEFDRPWWHIRHLRMIRSRNLTSWSEPVTVLEAEGDEHLFNNAIAHDGRRFVMLYETNDKRWPAFTFRFAESDDLVTWRKLSTDYLYGRDKYVGGPSLYWEGGMYYVLYVAALGEGRYGTGIVRSRDLAQWEEPPEGRLFLEPDGTRRPDPVQYPDVYELNASDAELIEWRGKVLLWWNGGNQLGVADLQHAWFDGTRRQLFEAFFA